MRRLNLAGNKFEVLPAPLEEATALEYLRLDDNPIHVIDHANAFPSLTNLKVLSMTYMTNLREIGRGGLSELTSLKELHVRNCPRLKKIDEYAMAYEVRRCIDDERKEKKRGRVKFTIRRSYRRARYGRR